jgi:hypothetical protein
MSKDLTTGSEQPFLLYSGDGGDVKLRVLMREETIWLTMNQIADLFDIDKSGISRHLKNIYETGELDEKSTVAIFATVQTEGERDVARQLEYYNLDAIIAVGYRVNSKRATQFRIWATNVLKEFIKKGFVMDDQRLKQGETLFGEDYFKELLERVRSIRTSERRIYLQITDIFAEISTDYNPKSRKATEFYAMVQNKFHYAITGHTAAEIVHGKADREAPHMGLTTWKNAPEGRILQSDVTIAKNYLPVDDISKLERTVSGFFDYIENIIENRIAMTMADMAESVDKFLSFNEFRLLAGKGKRSHAQAKRKALAEYAEFNKTQKINSDFEKQLAKVVKEKKAKARKDDADDIAALEEMAEEREEKPRGKK